MRKLNRSLSGVPECLSAYSAVVNNWADVSCQHKEEIRTSLEQMQGRICAYCEGSLDALGQHIEHFKRKRDFPHLTFSWENMYWSCDKTDSCGHYKDHGAGSYNVTELIEPCVDDPDKYFRFRSDGTISIRSNLNPKDQHRAAETLRVFNLDPQHGRLRSMRQRMLSGYVTMVDGVDCLDADEIAQYFADELVAASAQPFYTAIRHVLTEI